MMYYVIHKPHDLLSTYVCVVRNISHRHRCAMTSPQDIYLLYVLVCTCTMYQTNNIPMNTGTIITNLIMVQTHIFSTPLNHIVPKTELYSLRTCDCKTKYGYTSNEGETMKTPYGKLFFSQTARCHHRTLFLSSNVRITSLV